MLSEKQRQFFLSVWEFAQVIIVAAVIVIPIRMFVFQPFIVNGASMEPNFYSGDYLIIDELSYRFSEPQRGDVVVFKYPKDPKQRYIKRIIGLPGETVNIRDNHVYIQSKDKEYQLVETGYLPGEKSVTADLLRSTLTSGEYFVMGDNRFRSSDSRAWGPLPKDLIVGKVLVRPLSPKAILDFVTLQ